MDTRHTLYLQGSFGMGVTGGEAVQSGSRRVHARRRMADNPLDPHCCFPLAPSLARYASAKLPPQA
eukprot:727384-Pelagomonas_calceolata.AAC.1